jgi:hypothetical protein
MPRSIEKISTRHLRDHATSNEAVTKSRTSERNAFSADAKSVSDLTGKTIAMAAGALEAQLSKSGTGPGTRERVPLF